MGMLGNQPSRNDFRVSHDYLDAFIQDAISIAKKHSINVETVIQAKHALEMERYNSIESLAGDYLDEQMGGFGAILNRIADALED